MNTSTIYTNPVLKGFSPDPSVIRVMVGMYANNGETGAIAPADFD